MDVANSKAGRPYRVAIVVPALIQSGGVSTVARFLFDILETSELFEPYFVSVALSSRDTCSFRLLDPRSWLHGITVRRGDDDGRAYQHVGSYFPEIEFFKYCPRRTLTRLLNSFDLVQVVAGVPAWAFLARHAEVPVVLQVATLTKIERRELLRREKGLRSAWRRAMTSIVNRLDNLALKHVEAVFVENEWMYRHMQQLTPSTDIHFSPPGVDTVQFSPANGKQHAPYILSVGRFDDPRKNVRMLFESFAILKALLPEAPRMVLAGKRGPSTDDWEIARALGVREDIEFKSSLAQQDLAALYRNASLYVVSSDEEGLGMTILEAMSSGLPVVSTDCGGPRTSVVDGETGLLTGTGDQQALAHAVYRILTDTSLMQKMGRAGRKRIEESFSLQTTGDRFLKVYKRLLVV